MANQLKPQKRIVFNPIEGQFDAVNEYGYKDLNEARELKYIPNLITLDKQDGVLSEVDTQLNLINMMLVDNHGDVLTDHDGNIVTE